MLRSKMRSLLKSLFGRKGVENAMTDEIQFHLQARAEDLMARRGLPPDEALRRARVEFSLRCRSFSRF